VVYIAEGEKDVDALEAAGVVATCNPFGAGKWRPEYSPLFQDSPVIIIADRDDVGYQHARAVSESVASFCSSVKIVEAKTGKDAFDHLQAGHSPQEFLPAGFSLSRPAINSRRESEKKRKLNPRYIEDLLAEPRVDEDWLVDGLLLAGGVSMVAAKPKVGKSTFARDLALRVSRGEPFLGRQTVKGRVIYLALEEKQSQVTEHFGRMGAGNENLLLHVGSALDALDELDALIEELGPCLVVVDPLFRLLRIRDASAYAEVSNAIDPLIELARKRNCHLLLLHHMGKRGEENGDGVLGSTALFGSVDTLINLSKRAGGMRVVSTIQRSGVDLTETVLTIDPDTGAVSSGGEIEAVKLREASDTILNLL
jgi:hypothetical protein